MAHPNARTRSRQRTFAQTHPDAEPADPKLAQRLSDFEKETLARGVCAKCGGKLALADYTESERLYLCPCREGMARFQPSEAVDTDEIGHGFTPTPSKVIEGGRPPLDEPRYFHTPPLPSPWGVPARYTTLRPI
jgi:hypothetical protein